ncbi:hypothetical protein GBA52_008430, partial [Prunus armeniaca]
NPATTNPKATEPIPCDFLLPLPHAISSPSCDFLLPPPMADLRESENAFPHNHPPTLRTQNPSPCDFFLPPPHAISSPSCDFLLPPPMADLRESENSEFFIASSLGPPQISSPTLISFPHPDFFLPKFLPHPDFFSPNLRFILPIKINIKPQSKQRKKITLLGKKSATVISTLVV